MGPEGGGPEAPGGPVRGGGCMTEALAGRRPGQISLKRLISVEAVKNMEGLLNKNTKLMMCTTPLFDQKSVILCKQMAYTTWQILLQSMEAVKRKM